MKLYRTATGEFVGLKSCAGKDAIEVEVPAESGRATLAAWLNANVGPPARPADELPLAAPAPARKVKAAPVPKTGIAIAEFIIGEADQAEVERIFEALGCRLGEVLRDRRAK